jgi:hypothetical protein
VFTQRTVQKKNKRLCCSTSGIQHSLIGDGADFMQIVEWRERQRMDSYYWIYDKDFPDPYHYLNTLRSQAPALPFRGSRVLLKAWLWTFSLQNSDTMNFCFFKLPTFWCFIMAIVENKCSRKQKNYFLEEKFTLLVTFFRYIWPKEK